MLEPEEKVEYPVGNQPTSQEYSSETETGVGAGVKIPNSPTSDNKTTEKKKDSRERLRTALTVVALVFSALSLFVSFGSRRAADRSASAAEKSAAAATRSAAAGEQSAAATQQNVDTAKAALGAAIERDRRDQRAWVGPIGFLKRDVKVGEMPSWGARIKNTGKTPALGIKVLIMGKPLSQGEQFVPTYTVPIGRNVSVAVLQPGMDVKIWTVPEGKLTEDAADAVMNGVVIMYVYGEVSYDDIFGCRHYTTFCSFMTPDMKSMNSCNTYNDVTDGECPEHK
jgi:hypothetical protein